MSRAGRSFSRWCLARREGAGELGLRWPLGIFSCTQLVVQPSRGFSLGRCLGALTLSWVGRDAGAAGGDLLSGGVELAAKARGEPPHRQTALGSCGGGAGAWAGPPRCSYGP